MKEFIEKHQSQIRGCLSGFDRLVFRGSLRSLNWGTYDKERQVVVASGMENYCWQNKILFKDYGRHVQNVSQRVREQSLKPLVEADVPVEFVRDSGVDKDQLAREIAARRKVERGMVCAISALEPAPTFDYRKSRIVRRLRPCHVLYQYQVHPVLGWMHARLQTWFPFHIQIAINGREWLSRRMQQEGMKYTQVGNCFPWIEDFQQAQQWMNEQLKTSWGELLDGLAMMLNPLHEEIFAQFPASYYWTCYQSEWATDLVFGDAGYLKRLMTVLTPHAVLNFHCGDILRYFGKRVNQNGSIPANFDGQLQANLREYREGERVKFWARGNSLKFYSKAFVAEGSVLRAAETTINHPELFRSYRPKEGGPEDDLEWRPMRKGVADLHQRAVISQQINERLIDALAATDDSSRLEELVAPLQKRVSWKGRRVRGLRPLAEDYRLLEAINRGEFVILGVRNRDLQALLYDKPAANEREQRKRSAAVSRQLRMLRAHGLIHKVPRQHRYQIPTQARAALLAILTAARTSLNEINALRGKAA